MMEKDAFEVIDKINNGQSESSSSSSFFEYSLSSPQEKKLDSSSTTIHESSASGEHSTFSTALDEKLSSLQTQTTELRQQFKNRNQILRDEILQISEKQQSILKENEKLRKEIQNQEITVLSDDESDYSIIVPSENALKEKADESVIFQETLLQLHELTSKYTKLSQELVEERLKSDNLEKLLNEKDEQNRILKQFFDAAKQQSLKNAELQSELDSVKKELASTKLKLRELSEKAEESSREVEEHKEKFSRLQVSNAEIINALQTKAKFLFDALDAAEHDHGAARTCLAVAREKLEKVSNENKEMVELLSSLKVENEELKMERTVKDCEHQEQLDNLTAKLVDTEQRLERVQTFPKFFTD